MNPTNDRTIADLLRRVVTDLQEIVRSEVRLAKAEVKQEAGKAKHGTILIALGGVMALYAFGLLLLSILRMLSTVMEPWAGALSLAVVLGMTGFLFYTSGKKKLKDLNPKPEKTIDSVKENLQWNKRPSA